MHPTRPSIRHRVLAIPAMRALIICLGSLAPLNAQPPQSRDQVAGSPVPIFRVKGIVAEPGTRQPVSGADVTLTFLGDQPRTLVTAGSGGKTFFSAKSEADGAFSFTTLDTPGQYHIEVAKEGYGPGDAAAIGRDLSNVSTFVLDKEHPEWNGALALVRPGKLLGCIQDETSHNPISMLSLNALHVHYSRGRLRWLPAGNTRTDEKGCFKLPGLAPGDYVVEVRPSSSLHRLAAIGREDLGETFDEDYERSYWPGGSGLGSALPTTVYSGDSVNIGQLRLRKVRQFRVRVSLATSHCTPEMRVGLAVSDMRDGLLNLEDLGAIPCTTDSLIRGFQPGAYALEAWVQGGSREQRERGSVSFDVSTKNVSVTAPLQRGADIEGRIVAFEGSRLPEMNLIRVRLQPAGMAPFSDEGPTSPDKDGKFRIPNVAIRQHQVIVYALPPSFYVKEILYNGAPISNGQLVLNPSALSQSIRITIDDRPASIVGSAVEDGQPVKTPYLLLVPWPLEVDAIWSSAKSVDGDEDGRFQFSGLSAGQYRIVALPSSDKARIELPNVLAQLASQSPEVNLGRGATMMTTVKLSK